MNELVNKYQDQLDQALVLAEKLNKEKSYLIDLLIKDTSSSTPAIINKYIDWLEENESK